MKNSEKSIPSKTIPFIDYVPAEVKETTGDNWRIVFYARKPGTDQMVRFRRRVKKVTGYQNRMRYGKRICVEINRKLQDGWSPFINEYAKQEYKLFSEVLALYIEQSERKFKDGLLRKDTLRAYISFALNITIYLESKNKQDMFTVEVTKKLITEFLDYIYYDKKRTSRTSNNYLSFWRTFTLYMIDREYLGNNPTTGILPRKVGKKKREVIPSKSRNEIFEYFAEKNPEFLTLSLCVYFCFIRRTEISKLKVKHIDLVGDTIFIPKEISKNGKDGVVTIPKKLKTLLATHLSKAVNEDFLFSNDDFTPGKIQVAPKKISDAWLKMKKDLVMKNEYQFYSLKDTGITQLFLLNVPVIKIRDQARHHDIKITETYTPRNYVCDDTIKNLDFNF
jgi:integrase